jgi:WD40 repeat protein
MEKSGEIEIESVDMNDLQIEEKSPINNSYCLRGSYDINQMTNNQEKHALLKIKINPNIPNEFVLVNSNFQIHYMSISDEGVFHNNSFAKEHVDRVNDVCFFKDGQSPFDKAFISASSDGTIKIWDSRASSSVKTINVNQGKQVFTIDTNSEVLVAGLEREIGIWDLKMMKYTGKSKYLHSDDVTYVKVKNNNVLTGGEDGLINVLDISNGLNMDSIVSQVNIVQAVASLDFIDDEMNYIQAITTDHNYHVLNMFTGVSLFEFDAKNVNTYIFIFKKIF